MYCLRRNFDITAIKCLNLNNIIMKICFITTGDIKNIATAKRALGLANPLADLGWEVSIIMENCEENKHRTMMECDSRINLYFFNKCSMTQERKKKNDLIKEINPDFLYICAFVTRNIVGIKHKCKKIVEHSELQSGIPDMKGLRKLFCYIYEYYSIIYSDGLLNASRYLQNIYRRRSKKVFKGKMPMLYYPYAFNTNVVKVIEKENIKDKFKKYLSQPTLVFLGTVTRNYGVFTIIDAVKQLKDQTRPFNVLILGKGRHYEDAKTYVSENYLSDIIEMPGFVDEEDISQYFSVASAFISPMNDTTQDWARCPSKMYLYLPYKKPIITCKIGEPYEILQDKGFYYASGNAKDMATQMKKIIENNKYTADAHAEKHSWNVRAQELDNWIKLTWK
ncbi:glycosyltransferase [Phocaeicola vulgatus]|jgi:glycosyltransferase involved in cell wall biosynthesis|uniref:Glycosyltransferase n=2 Tax=Phocaeicola vulgatus TaxID=821 RepID=A0A414H2Q5_PHOVU|nr:glycosyltransferase [Phocaeicola vulgatus]KAB6478138.1 glycosyltransferase [Phocaeicola vulgatus]RGO85189.1 glycosyltransferase [Phocaeicola vulgatus]RGO91332.1 glycosyltransferase [Phocaeicola vulgatus]RHA02769.1 glycosyltransferase [Phocaeicola vulgatus]